MRVLVFTNMYPFEGMPFYGSFVKEEVAALQQAGCRVDVLFTNGIASKLNYFFSPYAFFSKLREGAYDLVHVHHSYCGFVATMQQKIPVVWTSHEGEIMSDDEIRRSDSNIKWLAYSRSFKRMVARRVDTVIVVSGFMKSQFGRADAYTLPCGIDTKLFSQMDRVRARVEMGLEPSKFYVLFPSTPTRVEKRFRLAEEAVAKARDDTGDIDIICLDNVPHEKVPIYMNAANLMLMTSSFEASPVTIREALSCNVPVISTDVGDAREVLNGIDGCRIVSSDPAEIGNAVSTTLKNHARVDGREKMMIYSLENTAAKLMTIYREITGEKEIA